LGADASAQPKPAYTNMDLWNKLNTSSVDAKPAINQQNTNGAVQNQNAELDRKYGINPQQQAQPVQPRPVQPQNLNSNIKVDDADIPPFLRRKFNK